MDVKLFGQALIKFFTGLLIVGLLFFILSMPLVLGSVIPFVITLLYIPIIKKRICNEGQVL